MLLTNAKVYTCDDTQSLATTVLIQDGLLTHVGESVDFSEAPDLEVHDLGGRVVIPGIIDSHTHPSMVSQSMWHIRLPWTDDVDEILRFVRQYAEAHPREEAPFLYFEYYPSTLFRGGAPTKELLDSAVSDRPCLCQDFSEHESWVNSKMLDLMEVTRETLDPTPGLEMFVRDAAGEPTGQVREAAHEHFIDKMYEKLGWTPPQDLTPERVAPFFRFMTSNGVTSLFEALVTDEQVVASIAELDRRGELNMYYDGALRFRRLKDLPQVIDRLRRCHEKYGNEHLRMNTVKLFLDGTNETGNSAVLQPRCGHADPNDLGEIIMDVDELIECVTVCNTAAVDLHIHLVGDRAFRNACDAVQEVRGRLEVAGEELLIHVTLAHCELVDPADLSRPGELGIFINWTPHWSGGYFGEISKQHLGDERWNRMYLFNEIAGGGAVLTFSSDVTTGYELNRGAPFFGMQVAHSRIDPEYPLDADRHAGSVRPPASARLSRELLLKGYTINGARQLRLDHKVGSLEVGKVANLVILDVDPFEVAADRLGTIVPAAVLFEGTLVEGSL
jgi:predicted amidohydrolase YtcJ